MDIAVFSIFPEIITEFSRHSLLGRAISGGQVTLSVHDIRDHATDVHRSVDDAPFGGGPGMVMTPGPIFAAVEAARPPRPLIALAASGPRFTQARAAELADLDGFSLLCGRYEGVDQRVVDHLCDESLSVGDVVLNGGEVAALSVIEAVTRLVKGVMGNDASADDESFSDGRVEYPHYTRPADFRGWAVPPVLRSGDHGAVQRWRRAQSLRTTLSNRPDLLTIGDLSDDDRSLVEAIERENAEGAPDVSP